MLLNISKKQTLASEVEEGIDVLLLKLSTSQLSTLVIRFIS